MDFYQYVNARIPGFDRCLSTADIEQLKELYDTFQLWSNTETNILNRSLESSAGVDYANDFEKVSAKRVMSQRALDEMIIQLKAQLQAPNKENVPTFK